MDRYSSARDIYKSIGIDTDKALERLRNTYISVHCWQGDDVCGFENSDGLSGGIQTTGNYPGKARNVGELMSDIDMAMKLIPGKKKLNLHAIYAVTDGRVERNKLNPEHFSAWVDYAKARSLGLDINGTLFSHKMAADGLTLSHPDKAVRDYWIEHCRNMRDVGEYFGRELGITAANNVWIPDGYKDVPADRLTPRLRLKESLDEVFREKKDKRYLVDTVESKVFGIGVEAYTVGSHEFYMNYAAQNDVYCLLDNGHFHPTETVSDKIPSLLAFTDRIALHVTRGIRWDSDHVVAFDDELKEICKELVRCNALEKAIIGLDYFDASINRVAAWVIGTRNMQKALLWALLIPYEKLRALQDEGNFTELLALTEEYKMYPFTDIWDYYCLSESVPLRETWLTQVKEYERRFLSNRT